MVDGVEVVGEAVVVDDVILVGEAMMVREEVVGGAIVVSGPAIKVVLMTPGAEQVGVMTPSFSVSSPIWSWIPSLHMQTPVAANVEPLDVVAERVEVVQLVIAGIEVSAGEGPSVVLEEVVDLSWSRK